MLERNLAALQRVHPALFQRVCLPADGSHVTRSEAGQFMYRHLRNWRSLAIGEDLLQHVRSQVAGNGEIFLFGIGSGEMIDALLKESPEARITAWERDPWLLRLALGQRDYSAALSSGRLRLALGADLVHHAALSSRAAVIEHPLLSGIYRAERRILERGLSDDRAVVIAGELFVDDLVDALEQEGFSVYVMDVRILSIEEMAITTQVFAPRFVAAINYKNGLAEFCRARGIGLLSWEIDPTRDTLRPVASPTGHARIFTYRAAQVEEFRQAGFDHVEYLPLATNPRRRFATRSAETDPARYQATASFVGASMAEQARKNRRDFLELYSRHEPSPVARAQGGDRLVEDVLAEQRKDYSRYLIPGLLAERAPAFLAALAQSEESLDPAKLIAEISASEKRLVYLSRLGSQGIQVWGDGYWRSLEGSGAIYKGPAEHFRELNDVYSGSLINVDIGRLYQSDMITMRVFDVMGCGGFVLAEYSDALNELFEIGVELDAYRTLDELEEKLRWYAARPERARTIAARGMHVVREKHTILGRVQTMLASAHWSRPAQRDVAGGADAGATARAKGRGEPIGQAARSCVFPAEC